MAVEKENKTTEMPGQFPETATRKPGFRSKWAGVPFRTIIAANLVTLFVIVVSILLWRLRGILVLIGFSLFLAAILYRPVRYLTSKGINRTLSVSIVFFSALGLMLALLYLLGAPAYYSLSHLVSRLPEIVKQAEHGRGPVGTLVLKLHLLNYVKSHEKLLESSVSSLSEPALKVGTTVLSGLVSLVTMGVLTFFILLEGHNLVDAIVGQFQENDQKRVRDILEKILASVFGYILGRVIIGLIASIVMLTGLYILGVPYPLAICVWVFLTEFLPIIGGFLGGAVTVLLSAFHSLDSGIIMLIIYITYLQLENHVLNQVVLARTLHLKGLWILLSVLLGADIGDIIGHASGAVILAIVAIPLAGAVQVLVQEFYSPKVKNEIT